MPSNLDLVFTRASRRSGLRTQTCSAFDYLACFTRASRRSGLKIVRRVHAARFLSFHAGKPPKRPERAALQCTDFKIISAVLTIFEKHPTLPWDEP